MKQRNFSPVHIRTKKLQKVGNLFILTLLLQALVLENFLVYISFQRQQELTGLLIVQQ